MRVALVSRDSCLLDLCRETLATLPDPCWSVLPVAPDTPPPAADLYIWDCQPATLPVISGRDVAFVPKPVDPAALRSALEQAACHANPPGQARRERDALLDCLLAAALRLQENEQQRMNFLARAVHDFRTPLTAVQGYCGMLLGGELGPLTTGQREVLERTAGSVRRLSRLAAALFQWSSGLRAGIQAQIREADIEECCRQALHEIRPLAAGKNIAVEMDLQPPGRTLCFDPSQVEQVLVNLLENSCKFTSRGGYIQVRGFPAFWERRTAGVAPEGAERRRIHTRLPNSYRMEVSDNGMGVRPEHLESIFQEYTSYGGGRDRSGSGLGLAICKRILAEHGGRIFAESGKQGVTFVFTLPFGGPVSAVGGAHQVAETAGREPA